MDSIQAQNTAQLSTLLRQHKDVIFKYPWFLKEALSYAAQNKDNKSIKTIIDQLSDPGLFQIFTKDNKPLGIFLFGTMHILPYEAIPQHIEKQIRWIAQQQDSVIFSEKEDDFYNNNPLKKNVLFWDPTQQIKIDMDAYRQAIKNIYSIDSEDSIYKEEETAQEAFKNACAQEEERLKTLYNNWNNENIIKILTTELLSNESIDALLKKKQTAEYDKAQAIEVLLNKGIKSMESFLPVITKEDLMEAWAQQLPETVQQKVRESTQGYKITLSDVHPNYLATIIAGLVTLKEKLINMYAPFLYNDLDGDISDLFPLTAVKKSLDTLTLRQQHECNPGYETLLPVSDTIGKELWFSGDIDAKVKGIFEKIINQAISASGQEKIALHQMFTHPIVFDYLFFNPIVNKTYTGNYLNSIDASTEENRNKVWWQEKILPLIKGKLAQQGNTPPVLIAYGAAHHMNTSDTGILNFIAKEPSLTLKKLAKNNDWIDCDIEATTQALKIAATAQFFKDNPSIDPNSIIENGSLNLADSHAKEKLSFLMAKGFQFDSVKEIWNIHHVSFEVMQQMLSHGLSPQLLFLSLFDDSHGENSFMQMQWVFEKYNIDPQSIIKEQRLDLSGAHMEEKLAFLMEKELDFHDITWFNCSSQLSQETIDKLLARGLKPQWLFRGFFSSHNEHSLTQMKTLLEAHPNIDSNVVFIGHSLSLYGTQMDEKLAFLLSKKLDPNQIYQFSGINHLSPDYIHKLITVHQVSINTMIRSISNLYEQPESSWLEAVIKSINEQSKGNLINPDTLDTALHQALKENNNAGAMLLLEQYPALVNFANKENELPILASHRAKNNEGVRICTYFGTEKPFDGSLDQDIEGILSTLSRLQKKEPYGFQHQQPLAKFYNQGNSHNRDTLFVFVLGIDTSMIPDIQALSKPLIDHNYPVITLGDGELPTNLVNIEQALQALDTSSFKKINIVISAHGLNAKKHLKAYQKEEQSHHRIILNHSFTEKTEDLFKIFAQQFSKQSISILNYACYSGLSVEKAADSFKDHPQVAIIALSSKDLPTHTEEENKAIFSLDSKSLQDEIESFPNSIFKKYLDNMYSVNNLPVVYKNGVVYDARYILQHIDNHAPLLAYIAQQDQTFPLLQEGNKLDLNRYALALEPAKYSEKVFDTGMITLDNELSDYESMRETEYKKCLKNSYGDKLYCEEKFGKPNFGRLQKYLFDYWDQRH